jgi:hypothetical protein
VGQADGAVGDHSVDLNSAAEAFDVAAQCVDEHVAALLRARDRGLCSLELFASSTWVISSASRSSRNSISARILLAFLRERFCAARDIFAVSSLNGLWGI